MLPLVLLLMSPLDTHSNQLSVHSFYSLGPTPSLPLHMLSSVPVMISAHLDPAHPFCHGHCVCCVIHMPVALMGWRGRREGNAHLRIQGLAKQNGDFLIDI